MGSHTSVVTGDVQREDADDSQPVYVEKESSPNLFTSEAFSFSLQL